MSKKSHWLKNYGFLARVYVVVVFFLLLNGLNIFVELKEVIGQRQNLPTGKYDSYIQGTIGGRFLPNTPEFDDFIRRKGLAAEEIIKILLEIEANGDNYTRVDYFRNMDRVMDLEDKYKLQLMGGVVMPFESVVQASRQAMLDHSPLTNEQEIYIKKIQDKYAFRSGLAPARPMSPINWWVVSAWILKKYFLLMLFWLSIYLIRFGERDKSIRIFKRHHSELGRFIEDREPYPGNLSLKNELFICPGRLLMRVLLWPKYCWNYPHYESPAQMFRFNRLKAEFLRYKPLGYQLTPREEAILLAKARKPVKDIERAVASLFQFPVLVKRSVYIGYLSLFFGVLLQPVISLAAGYSQKVDAHFYGQDQTMLVEQQNDTGPLIRDGTNISVQQHEQNFPDWQAVLPKPMDLQLVFDQLLKFIEKLKLKLPLLILDIDHVPLTRVVCAARC